MVADLLWADPTRSLSLCSLVPVQQAKLIGYSHLFNCIVQFELRHPMQYGVWHAQVAVCTAQYHIMPAGCGHNDLYLLC